MKSETQSEHVEHHRAETQTKHCNSGMTNLSSVTRSKHKGRRAEKGKKKSSAEGLRNHEEFPEPREWSASNRAGCRECLQSVAGEPSLSCWCRWQMAFVVWRVTHLTWPTCSVGCERSAHSARWCADVTERKVKEHASPPAFLDLELATVQRRINTQNHESGL